MKNGMLLSTGTRELSRVERLVAVGIRCLSSASGSLRSPATEVMLSASADIFAARCICLHLVALC